MKNNQKHIYLMSSNASIEYILDILETLAIPFGNVHHFRYQLRWLDENLRDIIPVKRIATGKKLEVVKNFIKKFMKSSHKNGIEKTLKNTKVVICYLYQVKTSGKMKWEAIYPIRTGILIGAYKTGENDDDIAHFYFKVDKYIRYDTKKTPSRYKKILQKLAEENWGKKYSFFGDSIGEEMVANENESRSAFHTICESFDQSHFKSPESKGGKYYPLFCFIDGLTKKGELVRPKYDKFLYRSYYDLVEGGTYYFEFMTYIPRSQIISNIIVKLITDSKYFSTPSEYNRVMTSRYNAESFTLISSLLEQTVWSIISFKLDINNSVDNKLPLNLPIYFNIKIKRKIIFRIINVISDFGLLAGTGSLAFKATFPTWSWWWIPTIIGYVLHFIGRLIIRFWKG